MISPQTILQNESTTSNISFGIFPEYRNDVDETVIQTFLGLSESMVRFTKGKPFTKETIQLLQEKLGSRLGGKLYPGGKDILFAWSFQCGKKKIVIKPYFNKDLASLILHHLTIDEFGSILTVTINQTLQDHIIIEIPPVIGFAKIATSSYSIPVLITTESAGEPLMSFPNVMSMIGDVCRSLALRGFIVDLYPANWRVNPSEPVLILEYIDLINSKKINNVKERIAGLELS